MADIQQSQRISAMMSNIFNPEIIFLQGINAAVKKNVWFFFL